MNGGILSLPVCILLVHDFIEVNGLVGENLIWSPVAFEGSFYRLVEVGEHARVQVVSFVVTRFRCREFLGLEGREALRHEVWHVCLIFVVYGASR